MTSWYDVEHVWLAGFTIGQVWAFFAPLVGGGVAALLTRWFRKRDDKVAQRERWLATKFQETYQLVSEAREYPGMPPNEAFECKRRLALAINQIDLFADEETKRSATEIVNGHIRGKSWVEYEELQTALRDRFRKAMGLPRLDSKVVGLSLFVVPVMSDPGRDGTSQE